MSNEFDPMIMELCEQNRVILKPRRLYLFRVDPQCARCVELAEKGRPPSEAATPARDSIMAQNLLDAIQIAHWHPRAYAAERAWLRQKAEGAR